MGSQSADGKDESGPTPEEVRAAVRAEFEQYLQDTLRGAADPLNDLLQRDTPDVWSSGDKSMSAAELADMLEAQIATASGPAEWNFRPEGFRWNLFAAAWRMTVRRHIKAVLELRRLGLLVELLPNARSAIEHAVLLRALGDAVAEGEGDAFIDAVEASAQDSARGMLSALERLDDATGSAFAELLSAARDSPSGQASMSRKQRAWSGDARALFERVEAARTFMSFTVGSARPSMQAWGAPCRTSSGSCTRAS